MMVIGTYLNVNGISLDACKDIMDFAPHVPFCYDNPHGFIQVYPGNYDCEILDEKTPGLLSEFDYDNITEDLVAECKVALMSEWLPFIHKLRELGAVVEARLGVIEYACY